MGSQVFAGLVSAQCCHKGSPCSQSACHFCDVPANPSVTGPPHTLATLVQLKLAIDYLHLEIHRRPAKYNYFILLLIYLMLLLAVMVVFFLVVEAEDRV